MAQNTPDSPFCVKVHRALRAEGLGLDALDERMTNPFIVHEIGGRLDSTAILQHIADALLPRDPRARAEAWLWEDFADRSINGYLLAAHWDDDRNWPLVRDALFGGASWLFRTFAVPRIREQKRAELRARTVGTWQDFRRLLDHLEARAPFAGFWLSDEPSVADVAIFAQLDSLRTALTPWQAYEIKLRPALTDWLDRVDDFTRYARPPAMMVA